METRAMAQQVRLSHWDSIMRERNESGKSIRSWCRENDICEKTYYYWQRKLRQVACDQYEDLKSSHQSGFAKVMLPEISTGKPPNDANQANQLQIEVSGIRIVADNTYPPEKLATLLKELVRP